MHTSTVVEDQEALDAGHLVQREPRRHLLFTLGRGGADALRPLGKRVARRPEARA